METIELTRKQFDNLKRYELDRDITSTECALLTIPTKNKWVNETSLLKSLYVQEGRTFGNKLYIVNTLIDEKDKIGIEEMIMPEKLAVVSHKVVGFIMPYIENINLYNMLNNYDVPNHQKVEYLKEIGAILRKMQLARKYANADNFYLGDLHEQNFIVNAATGKVNVVDMDSCTIGSAEPSPSKYLAGNPAVKKLPNKYPRSKNIEVNEDTDLLCYNLLVLNYISKTQTHQMSIEEYYTYIDYLSSLKFDKELIDCFSKIYIPAPNQSPEPLLDTLPDNIMPAHYNIFKAKTYKKQ